MVRLIHQDGITITTSIKTNHKRALQQIQNNMAKEGNGWLELAAEDADKTDYQVAINANGEYEIWDASGHLISNVNPPLKIDDNDAAIHIIRRLVHLTKYSKYNS